MKIHVKTAKKTRIEMLPLIDIVFLLLVFFIYAMLSMAVHRGLPVVLPTSTTARVERDPAISITVKEDGAIYLDKERVSLEGLAGALRQRVTTGKETSVLLFGDRRVPYQRLFKVLDRIRTGGVTKISLQAEADESH